MLGVEKTKVDHLGENTVEEVGLVSSILDKLHLRNLRNNQMDLLSGQLNNMATIIAITVVIN